MDYYYFPRSHWSRVVSLLIAEKGLEPTRHFVDIRKNATFDPSYMKLNPRGVVPTIVDGAQVVWDAPTIARHLETKAPPALFEPEETPDARRWGEALEDFPLMHLSYTVWVKGLRGEKSAEILRDKISRAADYATRYPELRKEYERKRRFFESFQEGVYDAAFCRKTDAECAEVLEEMARVVASRPWIGGDRYSFADAIATSILFRLVDIEHLDDWSRDPKHTLSGYLARLQARPSFDAVWKDDPLLAQT